MKKMIAAAACAAMVLSLTACGASAQNGSSSQQQGGQAQIANPFTTYATMEEAENALGFSLDLPDDVKEDSVNIRATSDGLLDVSYEMAENHISIRKAVGQEDISGDYNNYENCQEVSLEDDVTVTIKGDADKVYLAVWTEDEYAYAVSASEGLPQQDMVKLVDEIA